MTTALVVERVDDGADVRLDPYRSLTDMDLRRRIEPEGGYFMAEGHLVIARAAALGLRIESVLTAEKWLDRLAVDLAGWSGPVYVADDELLREITGYRVHRGALAMVRRPATHSLADVTATCGPLLILEDLVDHTNVGLAFRSAAALGIAGVVLSPGCADPLYRRAVRTSMGAVLELPWARAEAWPADLRALQRRIVALTPDPAAPALDQALSAGEATPMALLVGSEGPGLSASAREAASSLARIPMDAGIDSLNVAAAIAVACYALRMQGARHG
ncbi:MAG: TrmH family RNA methyltransferase [Candidatus Nanopelagicales bacterium]